MERVPVYVIDPQIEVTCAPGHIDHSQLVGGILRGIGGEGIPLCLILAHFALQLGIQGDELGVVLIGSGLDFQAVCRFRSGLCRVVLRKLPLRTSNSKDVFNDVTLVRPDFDVIGGFGRQVQAECGRFSALSCL